MTHDELLAKIKQAQKFHCEIYVGGQNDCSTEGTDPCYSCQIHSALRAVVELHKPDEKYDSFCDTCEEGRCPDCLSVDYPCPTIQAIERELG